MSQEPSPKDCIIVALELFAHEPDFTMDEVEPNVQQAIEEHPRLREVLSKCGLWEEVDVDIRQHLCWITEAPQQEQMDMGVPVREESPELLNALESMPALLDEDGQMPCWQVILSSRRLVMQIHHSGVDGVGLAMITGTLLSGASLEETVRQMADAAPQASAARAARPGCCAKVGSCCQMMSSFNRHANAPTHGCCCPFAASPIGSPSTVADIGDVRHVHLGPFPLQALKASSRAKGVTVNSTLLACAATALRDYVEEHSGDGDIPLTVAIPVNFKAPDVDNPETMRANNDFSTMIMDVPLSEDHNLPLIDPAAWSGGVVVGAWAAQASLSLLPMCMVAWMLRNATNRTNFIFSNVNGSTFTRAFTSVQAGVPKQVRAYAYGSLNGAVRVFLLVNSHGDDLHVGLTVDESVVEDRRRLASLLNQRILEACDLPLDLDRELTGAS